MTQVDPSPTRSELRAAQEAFSAVVERRPRRFTDPIIFEWSRVVDILPTSDQQMPTSTCRVLGLQSGSTYAQGIQTFRRILDSFAVEEDKL